MTQSDLARQQVAVDGSWAQVPMAIAEFLHPEHSKLARHVKSLHQYAGDRLIGVF